VFNAEFVDGVTDTKKLEVTHFQQTPTIFLFWNVYQDPRNDAMVSDIFLLLLKFQYC